MTTVIIDGVEYTPVIKEAGQPIMPDEWQVFGDKWYYINKDSDIYTLNVVFKYHSNNKNIRPTEELAEACLAMSQLAQLRNETWKRDWDWKPDWEDSESKYIIYYIENKPECDIFTISQCFLAFRTAEIRDEFLKKHRELIKKAKPLL